MGERQIIIHREAPKETRIQNSIIWDSALSTAARFSLIAMLSLPDSWDYSVRGMAAMLGISKDTMSKYLTELESAGYLKRNQSHSEAGKFAKTQYLLTDTPGNFGEEPDREPCPNSSDTDPAPCPNFSAPENSPQKKRTEQDLKEKKIKKEKKSAAESDMLFDRFWKAYPKKRDKMRARKAWEKLAPDMELCQVMSRALKQQKQSSDWLKDGGTYVPNPATWLNHHRWEDETEAPPPEETPPSWEERFGWH